jgi:hypothetical protein
MRHRDHLVARSHTERQQRDVQRARPGVDRDRVIGPHVRHKLLRQVRDLFAEHELPGVEDRGDRRVELGSDAGQLRLEVDERHLASSHGPSRGGRIPLWCASRPRRSGTPVRSCEQSGAG